MSIKEIAQRVGVSSSTVSRVLNKHEYRCSSEELRRKIYSAARDLNYVPNQIAQSLRSGTAYQAVLFHICIIVTCTENADPFYIELVNNIESEIHKNGCILSNIFYRSDFSNYTNEINENTLNLIEEILSEDEANGLIIVGKCSPQILAQLKNHRMNIVLVNRSSSDSDADEVFCDGEKIAKKAVSHLISLGHKKLRISVNVAESRV